MLRYFIVCFVLFLALSKNIFAQQPRFCERISSSGIGWSLIKSNAGGYVLAGQSVTSMYLSRINTDGSMVWGKRVSGWFRWATSVVQAPDNGYVLGGHGFGAGNWNDAMIVKTDSDGNPQWSRSYGTTDNVGEENGFAVVNTQDGGYLLAGNAYAFLPIVNHNVYFVKVDSDGNMQWSRVVGENGNDVGKSLVNTADGGYLAAGYGETATTGRDCYLVKLDNVGQLQWTKTIGGTGIDEAFSIISTSDGGYALAGYTNSYGAGGKDVYVIKTDAGANILWARTIGGTADDEGHAICQTSDGGYAITGATFSYGGTNGDAYLVKLDGAGSLEWTRTIGSPGADYGNAILETDNGGFLLTGVSSDNMYIVGLDASGYACCATGSVGTDAPAGGTVSTVGVASTLGYETGSGITSSVFGTITQQCITCDTAFSGSAVPDVSICKNASTNLAVNCSGPKPPYTYTWTPSTGLSNANVSNPVASPQVTTTYTIVVTAPQGCTVTDEVTVTVKEHELCVSANNTICSGQSVELSSEALGIASYSWSPGGQTISAITVSPAATTTYVLTGIFLNGCVDSAETVVGVQTCYPGTFCMSVADEVCSVKEWLYGRDIVQTTDGGYALAGTLGASGNNDVYLVKLRSDGMLQWSQTMGGSLGDEGNSLIQTADGGYAIAGHTYSFGTGGQDMYVIKTDAAGAIQWTRTIGGSGSGYEIAYSIIPTADGGYSVAGALSPTGTYDMVAIAKLDANGNLQWSKTVGTYTTTQQAYSHIQTSDGGYAFAGWATGYGGYKDVYIGKTDNAGVLQWSMSIGGSYEDYGQSIVQTTDGGYTVGGVYNSNTFHDNVFLVRLNSAGTFQWQKVTGVGSAGFAYSANDLILTSDGNYVIAGKKDSLVEDYVYLAKFNSAGNFMWRSVAGGTHEDIGNAVVQTADGGYAVIGEAFSVMKFDAYGNCCCRSGYGGVQMIQPFNTYTFGVSGTEGVAGSGGSILQTFFGTPSVWCTAASLPVSSDETEHAAPEVIVYPNPSNGIFNVQSADRIRSVEIFNLLGEKIYTANINSTNAAINLLRVPGGVYFLKLRIADGIIIKKIIKE